MPPQHLPTPKLLPMRGTILVQPIEQNRMTEKGIHLPEPRSGPKRVRVIAISPHDSSALLAQGICVDSVLLAELSQAIVVDAPQGFYVISISSVSAVECESTTTDSSADGRFLALPPWKDFRTDDYDKVWRQWENIGTFEFQIRYHEPFKSMAPVAKVLHDVCIRTLSKHVRFSNCFERKELEEKGGQHQWVLACNDDYWGGGVSLSESACVLTFKKHSTSLHSLVDTAPVWLDAIHATIASPEFRVAVEPDYSRVIVATLKISQIIRLDAKANFDEVVRNSESMGHFIKFGTTSPEDRISDPLRILGLDSMKPTVESIGRVDLKFSFERKIGDHPFLIFLTIEAPANDDSKLLFIYWEFQDHAPRNLANRRYGKVLSEFFRDVVLRGFYKTWLRDYRCTTLAHRGEM